MEDIHHIERKISLEILVAAPIVEVWQAWTTEAGVKTFFAPRCNIDLRPGGAYEMLFNPAADPGQQGGEGMMVMAVQQPHMIAFTWNAPPHMPDVRRQMTHVVIRLIAMGAAETRVTLYHDGWGVGAEWDEAFAYFSKAWGDVVLPRLKYRFDHGPVNWANPPAFD